MRRILVSLALSASAFAAVAGAQTTPPPSAPDGGPRGPAAMMMRADANGDGVITKAEAIAEADARFDRMDANHDGKVTPDEMAALRTAMRDRMTAAGRTPPPDGAPMPGMGRRMDANGDGVMTRAEAEARAAARFERMDANHDGKLDKTELANIGEMRHLKRREAQAGDTPPPPPPGE